MTEGITITAETFLEELRSIGRVSFTLVMPVGPITRRVPITGVDIHSATAQLHTHYGEVLTFPATNTAEIRRFRDVDGSRIFTRYELTFPLGEYFALIIGS